MRKYTAVCLLPLFVCALQAQSFLSGQAARAVIGQPTFSSGTANAQAYILGGASGIAYGNGYIWVADSNNLGFTPENNRVLLFTSSEIPGPYADLSSFTATNNPSGDSQCYLCGFSAYQVLGQADFVSYGTGRVPPATPSTASNLGGTGYMNNPTGVATDGTVLAVADTNNNRILIWNSLPLSSPNILPNVVLGQANFTTGTAQLGASGLSGPVGVWIQNHMLFVADTANSRVLIWTSIPTSNNQPANIVLGEPDFGTRPSTVPTTAAANRLYFPTSVTSDGTRLFVADTGFNRVLIWNSIPTASAQPADLVVGQPDMVSLVASNPAVCGGGPLCAASLNFPQFALSDGTRLYVSDTGDDRVMIYNTVPTSNTALADTVLGQPSFTQSVITSNSIAITSTLLDNTGAVDVVPSPTALAWDGTNLYVTDPSNRRVLLFTPADTPLTDFSVVNNASGPDAIRQEGIVTMTFGSGITTPVSGDTVSITIGSATYTYTINSKDTLDTIAQGLVSAINTSNSNAGDPTATALFAGAGTASVYLTSKAANPGFDAIALSATGSNTANEDPIASGSYLTSGNAGTGAAGMIVEVDGTNLSDNTVTNSAQAAAQQLVQVYMDGILTPLYSISPTQLVTQVPFSFTNGTAPSTDVSAISATDRNSSSVYVRTVHNNGAVTITNATPLYIAPANPGLFASPAFAGQARPWPAANAYHQSGNPNVIIDVDGTINKGDVGTITIASATYSYTVLSTDTLTTVQNALIALINSAPDPNVVASQGAAFNRIVLTARQSGAAGTGIAVSATVSSSADLTLTAYSSATCCDVTPNTLITPANPAAPGELISVSATGLGVTAVSGSSLATATNTVTATMGGSDAEVVSAATTSSENGGVYSIQLIVPTSLSASQFTQLYVAQNAFISNIVTIPVGSAVTAAPPGIGVASTPLIVSPPALVFANQNLGYSTTSQTITVTNPSSTPQAISSMQMAGANANSFAVTASTCPGSGSTLAAGASCTVTIGYSTGGTGVNSASFITYDGAGLAHYVSILGYTVAGFSIQSRYSGKVLDVTGLSTQNGALIQQWDYLSGANQQWNFAPVGNGSYAIVNSLSGMVLDVTGMSTINGAQIQQWTWLGNPNQEWNLVPVSGGYYKIQNVNSGMVLDVSGISTTDGTLIQQWESYSDPGNQQWSLIPVQFYKIQNVLSGLVLDVSGVSPDDGAAIQQWASYADPGNQEWSLIPVPGSGIYFSIQSRYSGKVLDVINQSTENGADLQQYDELFRTNQEFVFSATTVSGAFDIVNNASGRVLDVTGLSTSNGALIQQWDYLGNGNQQWILVPVGVPAQ